MWTPDPSDITTQSDQLEQAWEILRSERAIKLAATDWVILRNLETSEPVPIEWLDYRQALRDLPDSTIDPQNPIWPQEPV